MPASMQKVRESLARGAVCRVCKHKLVPESHAVSTRQCCSADCETTLASAQRAIRRRELRILQLQREVAAMRQQFET